MQINGQQITFLCPNVSLLDCHVIWYSMKKKSRSVAGWIPLLSNFFVYFKTEQEPKTSVISYECDITRIWQCTVLTLLHTGHTSLDLYWPWKRSTTNESLRFLYTSHASSATTCNTSTYHTGKWLLFNNCINNKHMSMFTQNYTDSLVVVAIPRLLSFIQLFS